MNGKIRTSLGCLSILAVVAVGTGCSAGNGEVPGDGQEPVRIGVVVPLSGDMAWAGEAVQAAGNFAAAEVNATGGINGRTVELTFEDDLATAANSVTAVQKLTDVSRVDAIVGPLMSANLVAVKPLVNAAQTVLIQPTSGNPDIFEPDGYVFSIEVAPAVSQKAHAEFLIAEKGFSTIALFGTHSDQTLALMGALEDYWAQGGGDVIFKNTFNATLTDFRTELTQIKALRPDVVWFTGSADNFGNLLRQMEELGFDRSTWIATDFEAVGSNLYRDFGSYLDGHFNYTQTGVPGDEVTQKLYDDFTDAFTASGGEVGPITHTSYDCFTILFEAMKAGASSGNELREALLGLDALPGATGYTTFNSDGHSERSIVMVTYADGKESHHIVK